VRILLANAMCVLLKPDNDYCKSLAAGGSVKGKGPTLITKVLERVCRSGRKAPRILNLGIIWR
jgi:hypothetical protein